MKHTTPGCTETPDEVEVAGRQPQRTVIEALAARRGGAAHATVEIATRLSDDPRVGEVVVITRRDSIIATNLASNAGVQVMALRRDGRMELLRRLCWQATRFPKLVSQPQPTQVLSWSGMLPRRLPVPLHAYLANPVVFAQGNPANRVRRWAIRRTIKNARRVLVPSTSMASLVEEALRVSPDIVPLGVDTERFRPQPFRGSEILCVADFYRHKRHDLLIDAWRALPTPRPTLRLIGDLTVDPGYQAGARELISRAAAYGVVEVSTGVPVDALVAAYHRARVLVLTSEQESFCMPLLEARACGVTAIARDLPVLRETGGPGTVFVDSDDPTFWAAAILAAFEHPASLSAGVTEGQEHALRFSWTRTVDAICAGLD